MPTADTREATISLPFAPGAVLESFTSTEALSELFVIDAFVRTEEDFDFFPHLGKQVTIKVKREGELARVFNGKIWEARYVDVSTAGFRYRLTLRPWLYDLSRNTDYAIFQEQSALDIIKKVFEARNCADVDYTKLSGAFETREYCVQYGESDFTFVSRLMEQEGIYYFFRHEDGKHTLVLCDARGSHRESEYGSLPFISPTGGSQTYAARMWSWIETVASGVEGQVRLRYFDFTKPSAPVESLYAQGERLPTEKAEVYEYPGDFLTTSLGDTRAQMILQADRRQRRGYRGEGDAVELACGDLVKLTKHPVSRFNQEYIVAAMTYAVANQQFRSGGEHDAPPSQVDIEATPAETPWRAPFVTPWPVARGPETAMVTGPQGEVLYTDKYGRVKVRFHWDRSDTAGEKTTCFIRVSHNSAGDSFGNVILPRIGQEVIVDFLDGDPDRPIITGRVYNAACMEPYGLPDNKTKSTWRSETVGTTGGDYAGAENPPGSGPGWNEISMEDASGKEQLYVYAQRDRTTNVKRDDAFTLGRDQTQRVGRDRTVAVKNNDSLTVEQGNESVKVSQGNMSIDVAQGNYSLATDLGSVNVKAMQQIVLTVGQNSITIDQTGVTINGLMIDVEGSAMTTIKGGIVMIN
ncbi:MAG: type VI secretion system Vgr family protein [Caulobacteraceae bacterium]